MFMSNNISPAILRVKDIITDPSTFADKIDPQIVEQLAELLLLSDGMSINPIIVERQGHGTKYTIYNGHETYAAALSLKDNPRFRGRLNCFIIGNEIGDAPMELIQRYLDVLRPTIDNEMGKNDLEKMDFDRIATPTGNTGNEPIPSASTSKPKPKYRPLSEEVRLKIEKSGRGDEPLPPDFKERKRDMSVARLQVFNCLKNGFGCAGEIARFLRKKVGTIRAMLAKMVKSEYDVIRAGRGLYMFTGPLPA